MSKNKTMLPQISQYNLLLPSDQESILDRFHSYLKSNKRINSKNSERAYLSNVKQFLIWCGQIEVGLPSETIALRNLIIKYEGALSATKLARNSRALKQNSVRKFFEFLDFVYELGLDIGKCFSSGFTSSSDPDAFKNQTRISENVFNAIKEIANSRTDNDRWIFFLLAWGCRRSEICTVRVANVDLGNGEINVFQHKQQSYKKIPIPSWLKELPEQDFLIRSAKSRGTEKVSEQFILEKIQSWISSTEFAETKITCHSFRRYFVGNLLKQGASDTNIARLGGWKNTQMLHRYGWDTSLENNPVVKMVKY